MQDKTLLRIALCCSIIGIIVLFFITKNIEIEPTAIERINLIEQMLNGGEVAIEGLVIGIRDIDNLQLITVGHESNVKVALFRDEKDHKGKEIKPGDKVKVTGIIKEFNGELEIVGEEMIII